MLFVPGHVVRFSGAGRWQCEKKCRSFTRLRLRPDYPTLPFDNAVADGQPKSAARILLPVQAREQLEHFSCILLFKTDSVVLYPECRSSILHRCVDVNPGCFA